MLSLWAAGWAGWQKLVASRDRGLGLEPLPVNSHTWVSRLWFETWEIRHLILSQTRFQPIWQACSRLYYGYCTTHGFRILYYSKSRGVAECTTVVLKPSQRTQRTGYPVYTLALLLPFRRQSIIFGKSRQEYSTVARVCHSLTTVKTELSWLGGSHSS